MFNERDFLPGQIAIMKPFKDSEIESFVMKNESIYDTIDVVDIIKACDSEYLKIQAEVARKKEG